MSDEHEKPWTNLGFGEAQARFQSQSQNARVWTEGWVARSMFCPSCGAEKIIQFPANRKLADFKCRDCHDRSDAVRRADRSGEFALDDVYAFEVHLSGLYPDNRNVRPKIRQQLQVLRDHGWLMFEGRGRYRLASVG